MDGQAVRKQKIIARSSTEAELHAAALGASGARGIQSMMCDLGFTVKPVLIIDAKATERISHRHGIGKMKHIDVTHLCFVKSEDNLVDVGTEALSNRINHQKACGIHGVC